MNDLVQKLAGLDLTDEQAALDDLKLQAAEITTAIARGHKRSLEIAREIEALKAGRGDGEAAAEALLEGDSVLLAAPQRQALEDERASIKAGMATLAEREREISHRRAGIIDIVESKSSAVFETHVVAMAERAKQLAAELAKIYADADAIGHSAANARAIRLSASLRDGLAGMRHVDALIGTEADVSSDLVQALQANPARPLLRRHVPQVVRIV